MGLLKFYDLKWVLKEAGLLWKTTAKNQGREKDIKQLKLF